MCCATARTVNDTEPVSFTGTAIDAEDLETDIALLWTSSLDGNFSNEGADSAGNIDFSAELSAGDHTITVPAGCTAEALSCHVMVTLPEAAAALQAAVMARASFL